MIRKIMFLLLVASFGAISCVEVESTNEKENDTAGVVNANDTLSQTLSMQYDQGNYVFNAATPGYKTTAVAPTGTDTAFFREEIRFFNDNAECKILLINPIVRSEYFPKNGTSSDAYYFDDATRLSLIKRVVGRFPNDISSYTNGVAICLTLKEEGKEDREYTSYKVGMFSSNDSKVDGYQNNASVDLKSITNPTPGQILIKGDFAVTLYHYAIDSTDTDDSIRINSAFFEGYFY